MRTPLIAGNWKMHHTIASGGALAGKIASNVADRAGMQVDVLIAPPATALAVVADRVAGSGVRVAAQDCHWADEGAFTGAISPVMVAEVASHVIVGHSERRSLFGEDDDDVNRKVHAVLAHGLAPVLCIGEDSEAREAGRTDDVVLDQLEAGLAGVAHDESGRVTVAYEPVWAIGTGQACDPEEAQRVCAMIRQALAGRFSDEHAGRMRILYGGSVKPDNIAGFMAQDDVDGALVGGASLEADSFLQLVDAADTH